MEASNVSFTCYNGDIHPLWAKCDGIVDCIGGSFEDEPEDCAYRRRNFTCNVEGQLQCNNGACVSADILCIYDISQSGYVKGCRDLSHLRSCEDFHCPEYTLKCPKSYCIPLRFRCNGRWDCIAGEDELNCDTSSPSLAAGEYSLPFPSTQRNIIRSAFLQFLTNESSVYGSTTPIQAVDEGIVSVVGPSGFSPTRYPFLAELELVSSNIELIPAAAFSNNGDLYSLSLFGNPISKIEKGAFSNLKNLRKLNLRDTGLPINSDIREALQEIKSLHTIYADTFTMCCIMELTPADSDDTTGCFAPADEFSSCSDLLKDTVLRISMWILGISAMVGNIFVIGLRAIRRHQVETSRIQSRLITHLAISDFFMGCYMMVIAGADFYFRGDYAIHADAWRASLLCRLAGFISTLSSEVSVFIIMLISLDRILCIVFVHHRDIQFSNKSCKIWLAVVWVISLVISLTPAVVPIAYFQQFYGKSSVCLGLPLTTERLPGWEYSITLFLGLNLVCFVVTAFCYVAIFVAVRRSAANFSKSKDHGRHTKRGMQVQVKLAAKMALIVGTDFICWMPIIIMGFLSAIRVVEIPADVYAWTAVFILPLNSSLNPYLYTLSTVWQRHRARQRANLKTDSDGVMETRLVSRVANTVDRDDSTRTREFHRILTSQCLLTPFNLPSATQRVLPLSKYIEEKGDSPSPEEAALIERCLRKGLNCLRSKTTRSWSITEDEIAVQVNSSGKVSRAFIVTVDPVVIEMLVGSKEQRNHIIHAGFMKKLTENLEQNAE
ncbi:lutropin-choriogonadotropic hormone receptor-like [Diadema setosum]|uniref:lutropin-choriogonadotropic hormone receptor-like n=1 Tax=Diadema setosum TaxID=31175 RepID=UPI003B3BCD8A